ncbi:phasin family protein [Bosea sp. 2KB_26]|uniref:phasin family protein n=1 Tax=Bosea sp. 2KB_26 TaxID=3237475 RepID=UPI003F90027A
MHDLSKDLTEPWQASLTAVTETTRLALDNIQKLSALQLNTLKTCMDLGFARLRAAADIKGAQDLVDFQAGQMEASVSLSERLNDAGKALTELGTGLISEWSKVAADGYEPAKPLRVDPPRKAA